MASVGQFKFRVRILIFWRGQTVWHGGMRHPILFEVNARQWMTGLREAHGPEVNLGTIPDSEIEQWVSCGVTHLWLMGVWPTGGISRGEALAHQDLKLAYGDALPDWSERDVMGSPYAVADLRVDTFLGGDAALACLRTRLNARGVRLVLDFVPNHLGRDHPWVADCPERFVGAPSAFEGSFRVKTASGERFLAHGKDPYFPGWTDTVQIEYRSREAREAMFDVLESISDRCDGVRCDMAMLVLEEVFRGTWGHVPYHGVQVEGGFWEEAISRVRRKYPAFLFLAEAYWGLEERLCGAGFDYAYDKTLYDRLVHDDAAGAAAHLTGMGEMNRRRAHFLENHDEPRAASLIGIERTKAALVTCLGLPGMRFLHDGQSEGRRRFARIQLVRRGAEEQDIGIARIYREAFAALRESVVGGADGEVLMPRPAWQGNESFRTFVIVLWRSPVGSDLVVVNLASHRAQCRVLLDVPEGIWVLRDRLGEEVWKRSGGEMRSEGLYLDLEPRMAQIFELSRGAEIKNCLG